MFEFVAATNLAWMSGQGIYTTVSRQREMITLRHVHGAVRASRVLGVERDGPPLDDEGAAPTGPVERPDLASLYFAWAIGAL